MTTTTSLTGSSEQASQRRASPVPGIDRYTPAIMNLLTRPLLLIVALAVLLSACGGGSDESASTTLATTTTTTTVPTTTTSTTTTSTTTTTTTVPPAADSINGLPADDDLIDRRVVAVKIDNHPDARPHSNLHVADAVYEVLVEGGLTRFIALFHQSDTTYLGPVRSGRPTDASLVMPLNGPFQISGAQSWVRRLFSAADLYMVYDTGATTFRARSRVAPHNLYTSTELIRDYADSRDWPDEPPLPLFPYANDAPEPAEEATSIVFQFSDHAASTWVWDGEQYLHSYGTEPHITIDTDLVEQQVSTDMIVAVEAGRYTAWDPAGRGQELPSLRTTGEWPAHIFYDGGVVHATWFRETEADPVTLFDENGEEITIPPGRVWIEVFPDDQPISWD